jgi:uncharacterized protein (DUF342 family)
MPPEAFVRTLRPFFLSVEPIQAGRSISEEHYDLIAKMSVDQLHFDGANTTVSDDRADLTMTFAVERPNGTEGLSEDELAALVQRDSMIGTALVQA